jgi:hypothetical protein
VLPFTFLEGEILIFVVEAAVPIAGQCSRQSFPPVFWQAKFQVLSIGNKVIKASPELRQLAEREHTDE